MRILNLPSTLNRLRVPLRQIAVTAVALAAAIACTPAFAQARPGGASSYAPGRVLVMPRAGLPDAALSNILKENGAGNARAVGRSQLRIVELTAGSEAAVLQRLLRNPHIKFAELDQYVGDAATSNDPYLGSQWHLGKIGAPSAWDVTLGSGVAIAILDSGVDSLHPDLAGRLVAGYNFVEGNTNTEDVRGHGTRVAGSAAATYNNGVGVASVAGQASIMPVRIADSTGYTTFSRVAQGLTYAADRGARVANVSFGGTITSSSVLSAAQYLKDRNGLAFFSAGNDGLDPNWGQTTSAIVVSATDSADQLASFSSYGSHVHLSAPGVGIYTTTWGQTYASVNGTSFSAPITAGVAALVMAANPSLTSSQVEKVLFSTALDLGASGRDVYFGYGRINASAAVAAAKSSTSIAGADATAPTVAIDSPGASVTLSGITAVNVSASDNVGVSKIELYVNGGLYASDSVSPFGFSWDTTKAPNGSATIEARAYDAAGNIGKSGLVTVSVNNQVALDTVAPTVAIVNPSNGSLVSGAATTIDGSASDNAGVAGIRMDLAINGRLVASSSGTGALKYRWATRKLATGTYTLTLTARDAAGNATTTSETVQR